jgi:hypothetical protein
MISALFYETNSHCTPTKYMVSEYELVCLTFVIEYDFHCVHYDSTGLPLKLILFDFYASAFLNPILGPK